MECKDCKYLEKYEFRPDGHNLDCWYCTACVKKGKYTRHLLTDDLKHCEGCVYEVSDIVPNL